MKEWRRQGNGSPGPFFDVFDRAGGQDVRRLHIDHARFIDHDSIARTLHVLRRPPSCDTRAEVDLPHTQSSSHLRPGLIGTPPVAVVGEQCMNTGCRSPDLARRHGRCFPGRSDGEHPPPLRAIRSSVRALYALGNAEATRA